MAYSLGPGCNDDDKNIDPDAWWDLHFCCDKFFTSSAECQVHRMFHSFMGAGGHGGRGGGGSVGNKGIASSTVARLVPAPGDDFFCRNNYENCRDDYFDEDSDSDDDYEDSSDSEVESYIRNMRNLVSLCAGPLTKCKKPRAKSTHASKAVCFDHLPYKFSKKMLFSLNAVPQTKLKKSRPKHFQESSAGCLDQSTYICKKCSKPFAVKPEYLLHMAIVHKKCGACEYKRQAHQQTDELWGYEHHFKSSPSCQYCCKGSLGDTAAIVEPGEEIFHPDAGGSIMSCFRS